MPHDIIDNRNEILIDHIKRALSTSERAKFALGYFFLSGFEGIKDELKNLKEVRLLIGNTTTRETLEQLSEGYRRFELVRQVQEKRRFVKRGREKEISQETSEHLKETISLTDQTDAQEELIITLARLIEEGKVKVRIYTKGRLHAKAYIFDYPAGERYEKGLAIVGSSNLSLSGVTDSTELNVVVPGNQNHEELTHWFNELWEEARDFDETLMNLLKTSWAMNPAKPYDIYIKTLYELVKDRIEGEAGAEVIWDAKLPPLAYFQKLAFRQGLQILNDFNGVFLADVVGTGKTYIGAAMLKHLSLKGFRPLIICPPALEETWKELCNDYEVPAQIISMGLLKEQGIDLIDDNRFRNRDIVLIDESHHFRHRDTQRYKILEPYIQTRKAILVTATPRNTVAWDIYHQLKLFHPEDTTFLPIDPPHLREFFKKVEDGEKRLPELLRYLLIRRTRRHILDWYGEDDGNGKKFIRIQGIPYYFPDRELETKTYSIEKAYRGLYQEIAFLIKELILAKYGLWSYVVQEKRNVSPYRELQKAGNNLRGLMRVLLFKRFESSVAAFRLSVKKLLDLHHDFLKALEQGIVPAGEEAQRLLYGSDQEDEVQLMESLEEVSRKYNISDFELEQVKTDIKHDIDVLEEIFEKVEDINPDEDDKLQELKELLREDKVKDQKTIIFTQFEDTANYLYENLKSIHNNVEEVSSKGSVLSVVRRFAPYSNNYKIKSHEKEIDILISTDVLSEGLNLQDGSVVINYDLHWNPVRLIQRAGRLDRIGALADKILVYNFLPELELERNLGLRDKLTNRIREIHESIGEDAKILDQNEQINEEAMYAVYEGRKEAFDLYEEKEELFSLGEAEEVIRQLKQNNKEYFDYILNLPDGIRSARVAEKEKNKGYFVFCQAGNYQGLYLVDKEGNIESRDISEVLSAIKCEPDEERKDLPRRYNRVVMKVKKNFEEEVKQRLAQRDEVVRLRDSQRYVLKELRNLFAKSEDDDLKAKINLLDKVYRSDLPLAAIGALNKLRREGVSGEALLERLDEIYYQFNLKMVLDQKRDRGSETETIVKIICSESLL